MQKNKFIFIYLTFFMTFVFAKNDCPRFYPMPVMDGLVVVVPIETTNEADMDCDNIPDRIDPDIDGDGFSNAEEAAAGTDPRNPKSHPPVIIDDGPKAVDDTVHRTEDGPIDIHVLDNDIGASLKLESVNAIGNSYGSFEKVGNIVRYNPIENYEGNVSFNYVVSDANGRTATGKIMVIVHYINRHPIAIDDNATTTEEQSVAIYVLDGDVDPNGDPISIIGHTEPVYGTVGLYGNTQNIFLYTPNVGFTGTDTFTYTISDGHGGTDEANVTIVVTPVPHPEAIEDNVTVEQNTTVVMDVLTNDKGEGLNITTFTQPSCGTVVQNVDFLLYTPDESCLGAYSFSYTIKDSHYHDENTTNVNIIVKAPLVANDIHEIAVEETPKEIAVLDANNEAVITDVLCDKGANITLSDDKKSIIYTPVHDFFGTEICIYDIAADVRGASAEINITVTNTPDTPHAYDDNTSTLEDHALIIDVLDNDYNPDKCEIDLSFVTPSSNGGTITQNNDASHTLTYTPKLHYVGHDEFTYTIKCVGRAEYSTAKVSIEISQINYPPVGHDDIATLDEDKNITIDVLANDYDLDSPSGAWKIVSVTGTTHGTCEIVNNKIVYTPNANYYGDEVCDYVFSDMDAEDPKTSNVGHISIHVNSVQDAPVAMDDTNTTTENSNGITIPVLVNDRDVDGDTLIITDINDSGTHGFVWIVNDTEIFYEPFFNFDGHDSFMYTITDGHGNEANATVYITVGNGINDAPIPFFDDYVTNEDTAINMDVLANDVDPENDHLSLTTSYTQPEHGTLVIESNNTFTYTPDHNYNGNDHFKYTVSDGVNNAQNDVFIIVDAVNDAPVAVDDDNTTNEDTAITLDILANDSDVETDKVNLVVTITEDADVHGEVVINGDNTVTYTPSDNFKGIAEFKYTITDEDGLVSGKVTVKITVAPVPDAPVAVADQGDTVVNTAITIDVLANDTDGDGHATLEIKDFNHFSVEHGSVSLSADQKKLVYTPADGFVGVDTFTYTITDNDPLTDDATATVTVDVQ